MDANKASAAELTIEVKALRIDGRKMTISVFRQLKVSNLVLRFGPTNEDARKNQYLKWWGYVRHEIPNQGDLWLVAEERGELVRCNLGSLDFGYESARNKLQRELRDEILDSQEQLFIAA